MSEDRLYKIAYVFLTSVVCFLIAAPAWASAPPDFSSAGSGYIIPASGTRILIDNSFAAPDGHMVFESESVANGGVQINYYDTQTGGWLLPQDISSAKDAIEEDRKLAQDGYSKLQHMPMLTLSDGTKIFDLVDTKGVCFHPYANFITIQRADGSVIQRALYFKLEQPETINSADDSSTAPHPVLASHSCGRTALKKIYNQEPGFFFADNAGGFFALVSRYAIHFDGAGNTDFFKGHEDPVLLSAADTEQLKNILSQVDKSRKPQDVIDQANALIVGAGQTQVQQEAQ